MSKLSRFAGKVEEHIIDGATLKFYPLSPSDQELLSKYDDRTTRAKATSEMIRLALKDEKDISNEDLRNMTFGAKTTFMEIILRQNGFGDKLAKIEEGNTLGESGQDNNQGEKG